MEYFFKASTIKLIYHSLSLSFGVTLISLIIGIMSSILFFSIASKNLKYLYILLLFAFFAIEPIIYLGAFQKSTLFMSISPFWQSVWVMSFPMSALLGLIFIFGTTFLDIESIRFASMVALKRNVFRFIVQPQLLFIFFVSSFTIFILIFSSQEVSSILGYRTYAEDFLAQVSLMDNINQAVVASLPFYLLATLLALFLTLFIQKYRLRHSKRERMTFGYFQIINSKITIASFGVLIIGFLTILILLGVKIEFTEITTLVEDNIRVVFNSLILAFVVSWASLIVAIFIYRSFELLKGYWLFVAVFVVILTFLTPSSLLAFKIIEIMQFFDFHTEWIDYLFFIFALTLKLSPLALLLIAILYHNRVKDESLKYFNISKKDIFFKIILPMEIKNWLLVVMILSIFALNELSMAILLIPIGFEIIIIKIYNLLHYGDYSTVTFLSLFQIAIIISILIGIWAGLRQKEKNR